MNGDKHVYNHLEVGLYMLQGAAYGAILFIGVLGFVWVLDFIGANFLPDEARSGRAAELIQTLPPAVLPA